MKFAVAALAVVLFLVAAVAVDARMQVADLRAENDKIAQRITDNTSRDRDLRQRLEAVEVRLPVVDENFTVLYDWAARVTAAVNRTAGGVQNLQTCTGLQRAVLLELAGSGRC